MSTLQGHQPADRSDVRTTNLVVVLRYVTAHAPCSRADIAAAMGLTKATVSSLVGDLIGRRLLRETGLTVHRVGRPATMIELDGSAYASIGVEVGAGRLTLVALDPTGRRLLSWHRAAPPVDAAPGRTLADTAALARRAVGRLRADVRRVLGLTMGVPGEVDGDGLVRCSAELGWRDVQAREPLHSALGTPDFPVGVEAGTVLAAKAEHRYGGHAGTADLVCLTGTHRVLAGVITGGAALRGGRAAAGRIGHLPAGAPTPGPVTACDCGRADCLDTVATVAALARRIDPADPLTDLDRSVDDAVRRARTGDRAVLDALDEVGRRLGAGLSPVVDVLDPTVVVLGGHYARLAAWLAPAAEAELRRRPTGGAIPLTASTLGHEAAAIGGAAAALDTLDAGHLPPGY